MLKDQLVGTWRLVTLVTERADGVTTHPYGPRAAGIFLFDVDGNFSVQLMNPDRSGENVDGYAAFWGDYHVDEVEQAFTLVPTASLIPAMIGMPTERHVAFSDGSAVFTPPPQLVDGIEAQTFITWRKISGS